MIHFMKNVSMIGGLLMLCAAGAGRYSLDGPCIRDIAGLFQQERV
jgi:uncharacterized membrane protein YphA (DoxX/SURF4 family)